jgi:hypothetical protein
MGEGDAGVGHMDGAQVEDATVSERPDAQAYEPVALDASVAQGTARSISAPPSYLGTTNAGSACDKSYRTAGFEPADAPGTKHPLFLYFVGTTVFADDQGSRYDGQAPLKVAEAMARRGFVALSVEYDNGLSLQFLNKMACMFGPSNAASLIAEACALQSVDCDLGIATWGHSQGALVAHSATSLEPRIRAVWTTGYGGVDGLPLSYHRLRVVNGENDTMNNSAATLNKAAGFTANECPDDGRSSCLRADGSGWVLVRKFACQESAADHCWFDKRNCAAMSETLEPSWVDADSTYPFALESSADWLAYTLRSP